MEDFVLLLQEIKYHPNSYMDKLYAQFEVTSIVHISRKDELKKYTKAPLFDEKYLVIFDDLRVFENNKTYISFKTMFVILRVESASQLDDARFFCREHKLLYKIYRNMFTREEAMELIQKQATQQASDAFCKAVIKQTGLNPLRIITALSVCEQLGYSVEIIDKYIDKWMYPDIRKLIECLLGAPPSAAAVRASATYLLINRHWYRYVKKTLLEELDMLLDVYRDKLAGVVGSEDMLAYLDEKKLTRARVLYALKLFEKVSITSVFALREFIKSAQLMEVALRLMGG